MAMVFVIDVTSIALRPIVKEGAKTPFGPAMSDFGPPSPSLDLPVTCHALLTYVGESNLSNIAIFSFSWKCIKLMIFLHAANSLLDPRLTAVTRS